MARAEGQQEAVSSRRAMVFSWFRSVFGPGSGRQEAVSSRRARVFSFGSGVTFGPGNWDGRRLFRHAVPGCFPDLKGVLWLVLCAWNNCLPDP